MKHFKVQEFVPRDVYQYLGDDALRLIDPRLIEVMEWLRDELNAPITINNWHLGGQFQQRGLRPNTSEIVRSKKTLYLSAHCFGMAADFDVQGMTAEQVRRWIYANKELMPHAVRLESKVNWVHLDVSNLTNKLILF